MHDADKSAPEREASRGIKARLRMAGQLLQENSRPPTAVVKLSKLPTVATNGQSRHDNFTPLSVLIVFKNGNGAISFNEGQDTHAIAKPITHVSSRVLSWTEGNMFSKESQLEHANEIRPSSIKDAAAISSSVPSDFNEGQLRHSIDK